MLKQRQLPVPGTGPDAGKQAKVSKADIARAKAEAAEKAAAAAAAAADAGARMAAEEARRKFTRIDSFEGGFDFLALTHPCVVGWDGRVFGCAHWALLAAQYPEAAEALEKASTTKEAREAVKGEPEAEDWSKRRLKAMEHIQRDKFRRSDDFRKRLKDTGDRELVWENTEDAFWGSERGKGQNQLGRVLMDVRSSVIDGTELDMWLFVNCELESEEMGRPPVELVEQKFDAEGAVVESKVHRLSGSGTYKFGKLPKSAVVATHPSISREHAMLIHTKAKAARRFGGLALMDLGTKSGIEVGGRKLAHPWVMEPLRNGDVIKLGVSTRTYTVKVNLQHQIEQLELQQRELMKEVAAIDADAANPVEAAKRAEKEKATVFVGGLDFEVEKADILGLFQDCGHVEEVRFPGGEMNASRGICFVVFDSSMAARRACGLSGEQFKNRRIKVAPASENQSKGAGKGFESGGGKGGKDGKGKGGKGGKGRSPPPDGGRRGHRSPSPKNTREMHQRSSGGGRGGRSESPKGSRDMLQRDAGRDRDRGGRSDSPKRRPRDDDTERRGGRRRERSRSRSCTPPKRRARSPSEKRRPPSRKRARSPSEKARAKGKRKERERSKSSSSDSGSASSAPQRKRKK